MAERGVQVDHATLNRWVVKYSPDIAKTAQKTLDFMLSKRRDKAAVRLFFRSAIKKSGGPKGNVIDKSGAV